MEARQREPEFRKYQFTGWIVFVAGICGTAFFWFLFPTTAPHSETVNLDALNHRLVGVIACVGLCLAGLAFLILDRMERSAELQRRIADALENKR